MTCRHCGAPIVHKLGRIFWAIGEVVFPQYCRMPFGGELHAPKEDDRG
jgi:hypothetical protein